MNSTLTILSGVTGQKYEVEVSPDWRVSELKQVLQQATSIPIDDQILLMNSIKLENKATLRSQGLPDVNRQVFLFDRQLLKPNSPPPQLAPPTIQTFEMKANLTNPSKPRPSQNDSPVTWLLYYTDEFTADLDKLQDATTVLKKRLDICNTSLSQQDTQLHALVSAGENMTEHYYKKIMDTFLKFKKMYEESSEKHSQLLKSFPSDLQKLRDTPLHKSLITQTRKTLVDLVPQSNLLKWAEYCEQQDRQYKYMVLELESQIRDLETNYNFEMKEMNGLHSDVLKTLRSRLDAEGKAVDSLSQSMVQFSNDLTLIRSRTNMTVSANSLVGLDEVQAKHQEPLQFIELRDNLLKKLVTDCINAKTKLSSAIQKHLQNISNLQNRIKSQWYKLVGLNEAHNTIAKEFNQLR